MLRRSCVWGYLFAAFGFGLLIGMWIEGGFLAHCFGFGMLFYGVSHLCRKQA